jgi:hypothetical protein
MQKLFGAIVTLGVLALATGPAAASEPARYVGNLKPPADAQAQKDAFRKFGEVSCNDCEGGIDFDSRPKHDYDEYSGNYAEWPRRAGNWPVGHVHRWKGKASIGTITVVKEEQVEGLKCRRLEYRLVRGNASAVRPGLICFGLASRDSSVENWHEVY